MRECILLPSQGLESHIAGLCGGLVEVKLDGRSVLPLFDRCDGTKKARTGNEVAVAADA